MAGERGQRLESGVTAKALGGNQFRIYLGRLSAVEPERWLLRSGRQREAEKLGWEE